MKKLLLILLIFASQFVGRIECAEAGQQRVAMDVAQPRERLNFAQARREVDGVMVRFGRLTDIQKCKLSEFASLNQISERLDPVMQQLDELFRHEEINDDDHLLEELEGIMGITSNKINVIEADPPFSQIVNIATRIVDTDDLQRYWEHVETWAR